MSKIKIVYQSRKRENRIKFELTEEEFESIKLKYIDLFENDKRKFHTILYDIEYPMEVNTHFLKMKRIGHKVTIGDIKRFARDFYNPISLRPKLPKI